jgi:hypothetical protein
MKKMLKKPEPVTTTKTVITHGRRPVKRLINQPVPPEATGPLTPEGERPKPLVSPRNRRFVAIQVGDLVTVKGDRDQKYVVTSMPPRSDKRGAEVELLEPGGKLVKKPLGWCRPYKPDLERHNGADPTEQ